jgi:hypothetical protein
MTKQTTKPPSDPVESAFAMIERACKAINENPVPFKSDYESVAPMLHTVLIVRAIDRLTTAVKDNTAQMEKSADQVFKAVEDVARNVT